MDEQPLTRRARRLAESAPAAQPRRNGPPVPELGRGPAPEPAAPPPIDDEPAVRATVPPELPVPTGARPPGGTTITPSTRPRTPAPTGSRAGRNLPAAIGVGLGLAVIIIASLAFRKEAFVGLVVLALCLGVWELTRSFAARRIEVPMVPILVGTVGMHASAFTGGAQALTIAFVLTILAVVVWRVLEPVEGAVRDVAAGVFVAAYAPFLAGFAPLMLAEPDGVWRIVAFILVVVCSDVGGYVFGVIWGRHPLAPSVSPRKSWEGLAGSAVLGMVGAVAVVTVGLGGPWWAGVALGAATVLCATVGDLSESLLKRDLGIKDMGSILPGHGGLMDRLDSLLPTAPVAYLLLAVMVPVTT